MQEAPQAASIVQDSLPHTANVVVHVLFGPMALVVGLIQLLRRKGDARHIRYGRWFLVCIWVSVATAAIGIAAFEFRVFLGVITLLVAYWAFSGYRALQIRVNGPTRLDALGSIAALCAAGGFVLYLKTIPFPWAPTVIYSTLATLVAVALYDLTRFAFPRRWFRKIWWYEHLVKMIGAYTAAVSAFSGTVLGAWQPYSQLLPSILGTAVMLGFVFYFLRRPVAWASTPTGEREA